MKAGACGDMQAPVSLSCIPTCTFDRESNTHNCRL